MSRPSTSNAVDAMTADERAIFVRMIAGAALARVTRDLAQESASPAARSDPPAEGSTR